MAGRLMARVFGDQDWSWRMRGLCHGRGDVFFPDRTSHYRTYLMRTDRVAKALCARCPVREDCLRAGLKEEYGIWGGSMPWERKGHKDVIGLLDKLTEQAVSLGLCYREGSA